MMEKKMTTEEILAMINELQQQLREKSKELTVFKNAVKKDTAKTNVESTVKRKMSCVELQEMSDFLQAELTKMGTFDRRMFWQEDWELLKLMATEAELTLAQLSELWARIKIFGLDVCYPKGWTQFRDYMNAA